MISLLISEISCFVACTDPPNTEISLDVASSSLRHQDLTCLKEVIEVEPVWFHLDRAHETGQNFVVRAVVLLY